MRPSVLAALVVLVGSAAGCSNGRVSEQDDVRATVRTFLDQCADSSVLRIMPELVPAAQKALVHAGSTTRGCARVLRLGGSAAIVPADFAASTIRLDSFDGARARVHVTIAGLTTSVVLSRGTERWRIEGP